MVDQRGLDMNTNTTATVAVNNPAEGLSVIGIDIYVESRRMHIFSTKKFIDELNSTPLLDRDAIRFAITKQYGIPKGNIQFQ